MFHVPGFIDGLTINGKFVSSYSHCLNNHETSLRATLACL